MGSNNAFCINCGEEIPSDTEICTECGANQDPSELGANNYSEETNHDGFTSWAIGFKPGYTLRNIIVAFLYITITSVGILLIVYAYLVENPKYTKYAGYYAAVSLSGFGLFLFALGVSTSGIIVSMIGSLFVIGIGVLFIPQVRQKLNIKTVPGVDKENTAGRNIAIGFIYYFISTIAVTGILGVTVAI